MKVGATIVDGAKVYGKIEGNSFYPFRSGGKPVRDLAEVIAAGATPDATASGLDLAKIHLAAPVGPLPKNVFCVGKNYVDHSLEFARSGFDSTNKSLELPKYPIIFSKGATAIAAPGQAINAASDPTGTVDYEGEVGVVIGRECKGVDAASAYDYVYGYTIINDVTSRELQHRHGQWLIGKNLDGFCPIGPWIVTADEMGPLDNIRLMTFVNGEQRQSALMKDMIFDVPAIIATLSAYITLVPGDVIATGTPVGVGIGFKPPRYLKAGDEVRITVDKIGELVNPVV